MLISSTPTENAIAKYRYPLGISKCSPSRHERQADQQQKRQRQHLDGRVARDEAPIERDTTIMTRIATTIAATMTARSLTSPTAVNTESSEKTMSMRPICTMIAGEAAGEALRADRGARHPRAS